MMATILKIILVLGLLAAFIGGTIYLAPKAGIQSEFSKRLIYRKESDLILDALENLVKVDCDGIQSEPWYCNNAKFEIEKVEPYHETLYAQGIGKTGDNKEFFWVAAKMRGFWGTIYLENTDKSLPECADVKDFPADIFAEKLRYCIDSGEKIDRAE